MTDLSPLCQAALDYAARGWHVFPLVPNSKDPLISKRMGGRGFWDATTDLDRIRRWWTVTPDANIGLGLIQSGLVCVDADTYRPDCEWPTFIAGRDLPDTLVQRSASGGTHYLFRAPRTADYPGHLCKYVDIKHKGYIVLEPSTYEGRSYQWQTDDEPADAPDWLTSAPPVTRAPPTHVGARLTLDPRIRAYCDNAIAAELGAVRNAQPGTRNNTLNAAAFAIGQIVEAGYADEADMISALVEATAEWDNPAKNLGTIHSGIEGGKRTPRSFPMEDDPPFDRAAAEAMADAMWDAFERKERENLPDTWAAETKKFSNGADYATPSLDFLLSGTAGPMPPVYELANGILGDIYSHVRSAMRRDWPEAAFLVALNISGLCIGRNFATWSNLRSNLYTVVLAKSGWGKSSIYGPAVDLLIQAGLKETIGAERIMSDSALIQEIKSQYEHKKIYFLDEFGHMLQRCNEKGAGGHMRKIVTEFTNLFSKANGFYAGSAYADGRDRGEMHCPHLNIFGMATPRQFWEAFSSGSLEDGTLPRFSILKPSSRPQRKDLPPNHGDMVEAARTALAPKLAAIYAMRKSKPGNIGDAPGAEPEVYKVMPTSEANQVYRDIEDHAEKLSIDLEDNHPDKDLGGILARVAETAAKIALIFSVTRNPTEPMITQIDMMAGCRLSWWFAHVAIEGSLIHIADGEKQAMRQGVLDFIRSGNGAQRSRRDILRKTKLSARDLDDVLSALIDSELVRKAETKPTGGGQGRPSINYIALKE